MRSRNALLEAAARGLSRYGYAGLNLEAIAKDAGYTRGALYHQFDGKEDLALAVLDWVDETWREEVGSGVEEAADPLAALIALARGHAVYCRRDIARVRMALKLEFSDREHAIGVRLDEISESLVKRCARLIEACRKAGSVPPGPSPRITALAFVGAMEGAVIHLAGLAPDDELLAARAAAGALGIDAGSIH